MAALLDVGLNTVLLVFHHGAARACQYQHSGLIGHGRFLEERDRADLIALSDERFFGSGETIAVLVFDIQFAVAFDEDDAFLGILGDTDQRTGQLNL